MSNLPPDATLDDISEELMLQKTLLASLDPFDEDYEERRQEMRQEVSLIEERFNNYQEPVDTSDSSISFDSATSLTVPSTISRLDGSAKRPLPSSFASHAAKRPSPSPRSGSASYEEQLRERLKRQESTFALRKQQADRDALFARALGQQPYVQPGPSSRPAFQSTLQQDGSVLPPTRPLMTQQGATTLPQTGFQYQPRNSTNAPQSVGSSDDDVIDLTSDEIPQRRSLYPSLPTQQPGVLPPHLQSSTIPPGNRSFHPIYGSYSPAGPSSSRALPIPTSAFSDHLRSLQTLVTGASGRTGPEWQDRSYDDDDDDDLVYQGSSRMPGAFPGSEFAPYPSNMYAGQQDLYMQRYHEIEAYNPEKTKEEINDLLNNIRPDEDLPDELLIQTPEAMSIKLHKYQELGLTWLKKCEEGTNQGGILADDMGLGKTIQMMSLIVSRKSTDPRCKTTLVVAPVALLRQWKQEIEQKIKRGRALTVHIHHQATKKQNFHDLAHFDVVLTTYGSLAIEARRMEKYLLRKKNDAQATPRSDERCILIGQDAKWYRVILDEAQCIKNRQTLTARAAFMLNATYRFCMTGTPMMNNVIEFYSLVKFLRIKPYDRWEKFRTDISQPLKGGMDRDRAMQRLQALCKAVMLRRTKKSQYRGKPILVLPERSTEVDHATFDEDEQELYQALEQKTQITFNKYLAANAVGRSYSAILVLLLRLRQACCHPFLIKDLSIAAAADMSSDELFDLAIQLSESAVNRIKETNGNFECPICMDAVINPAIFLPCGHDTCRECYVKLADASTGIAQGHENGVKARCPHCRGDIDPKKITDFISFKRVWQPELLTNEEKEQFGILEEVKQQEQQEADVTTESETEAEDSDDDDDMADFIVDDDDTESELDKPTKKESKREVKDEVDSDITDFEDTFSTKKAGKRKAVEKKPKRSRKGKGKKAAPVEKVEKRLTFANLKAGASAKKKAILMEKLRDSYKDSAKIRQLLALLDQITADDPTEKVLVFSQWTSLLDLVEIAMQPKGWDYRRYDGSMNAKERADAVDDFKDDRKDVRIMLVSLKAGNAGLNLNVASQVIILDPFWNPYIEEQAIDRAHRIGQTRPVKVHRVLVEGTVEDRILALQENKRKIIETALDEQQASQLSRLGPRELAYLFGISRNL